MLTDDVAPLSTNDHSPGTTHDEKMKRIKRPMNAFMVWSQIRRQEISSNGGKFHNSDISKMLGAEWRGMAEDEKQPFVEKARELREEHFREHPDYVYRPRRRKRNNSFVKTKSPKETPASTPEVAPESNLQTVLLQNLVYAQLLNTLNPQTLLNFASILNGVSTSDAKVEPKTE